MARKSGADQFYFYRKDVTIIAVIKAKAVVGVGVMDNDGPGTVTTISQSRFDELVRMVGKAPKEKDIIRDTNGINEFYVGDMGDGN